MSENGLKHSFTEIFPSSVLVCSWPDSKTLNSNLLEIILSKEQADPGIEASNVGGWHSKKDLHTWGGEAIAELIDRIHYARRLMLFREFGKVPDSYSSDWVVKAWANVSRPGNYNKFHSHVRNRNLWSGVYYVEVGNESTGCSVGGEIVFADLHRVEPTNRPESQERYVISPSSGMLLLFSSGLVHSVTPYSGNGKRVSVAFNLRHGQFSTLANEMDETQPRK